MSPYRVLLNRDGSLNPAAFDAILANHIHDETNLALCVRARITMSRGVPLGNSNAWYAKQAAQLDAALLTPADRAGIERQERAHMVQLVNAVRDAWLHTRDMQVKGLWT